MLKVIYEWRVAPENTEEFRALWARVTDQIHASTPGAMGSSMLRSVEDPAVILTVAKWSSYDAWKGFFGDSNPVLMKAMRALGERVSVNAYEEVEDRTH